MQYLQSPVQQSAINQVMLIIKKSPNEAKLRDGPGSTGESTKCLKKS